MFTCTGYYACSASDEPTTSSPTAGDETAAISETTWLDNYDDALKLANETGRPILVDFTGSDWCGWCIKLKKEVFSTEAFASYAKANLVLLELDFPQSKEQTEALKAQNQKLAEQFGIEGFPTILLLNAEGKELARTGYKAGGPEKYVEHLTSLLPAK